MTAQTKSLVLTEIAEIHVTVVITRIVLLKIIDLFVHAVMDTKEILTALVALWVAVQIQSVTPEKLV